jgi:hypothetical protein
VPAPIAIADEQNLLQDALDSRNDAAFSMIADE